MRTGVRWGSRGSRSVCASSPRVMLNTTKLAPREAPMHGMHRLCAAGFAAIVLAASAVTGETASAATAAWWHMNEASGTTMHDAVGSADGILHKVALNRPGIWGSRAYGFNGWSSYVSVPHQAALNPGSAKLTLRISVRFTAIPSEDYD